MRNALAHGAESSRCVVSASIVTTFVQDDAEATGARSPTSCGRQCLLARLMNEAEANVLALMNFPASHRTRLQSTNPIERLNGEIKRRTEVVELPQGRRYQVSRRHYLARTEQ
ncbi:transposase [Bradyrhizobium sp. AZCC 1678]|uniref:transposase n=1 Tax=Bradyrhizobium sp. AZCC 1678 TaxID=3117030 RepID=UPI002FF0369D